MGTHVFEWQFCVPASLPLVALDGGGNDHVNAHRMCQLLTPHKPPTQNCAGPVPGHKAI